MLTASNSQSSGLWMLQKPPMYITLTATFMFTGPTSDRYGICYLVFRHWSYLHAGHPNVLGNHIYNSTSLAPILSQMPPSYFLKIHFNTTLTVPLSPKWSLSPSWFPPQHPVHWPQSLNIYWSEECFNKTVVGKTKTIYIHYTFRKSYRFQKEQRYFRNVCHSLNVPTCHLAFSKVILVTCQPQYTKAKWKQDADLCRSPTVCPLRIAEHRQQDRK